MDKISQEEKEKALREILFIPCETKEHLHAWVKAYLDLDLPSSTVCHTDTDFEPSNSNPMDLLWEVYDSARRGDRTKSRYLYYAARGSYKSVLASVIEILCLFHLRRDVGHMAANKHQSKVVQKYLKNYLKRPVLRDYMTSKNDSEVSVAWYENSDGGKLTPDQYKVLLENNPSVAKEYIEKSYLVTIVVATLGGTNSLHVSMLIMDELDLTPAEVISEAMLIPANGKEYGEPPMVLMTSSRKFALGPVQDALDNAHKTGTHIRHWNVLDVTAKSLDGDTILFPCNQNPKKLKEFKVGDLVYGVNNLGQTIQTKVLALYDHGTLDAFEVTFNDGYRVVCSKDHRFLTPLGQLPLEEIVENGLEVFCGRSEKRWGLEDLLRTKFSNKKGIRQTSSAGVSNLSCGWSGSSSCQEEKVVARQSEKSTRSSMFSVECLKILEGEESRKREDQDKQVSGGSKALEKGKPRGSQGCNRPYAPRRQTMGKSQSRQGSRESAENANCTKVICFEARTLASGFWNTDLGASPNSLRQESQASGLRVARPFYMGGGRWVLPLLCPQESTERYWCAIEERSVTRHDVEPRVYSPRQRDADSAVDGILQQQDGRTKAGMGEVAWEYAPLASTRGLVLRKIVSVVSVGKRRMYDLGVAHPKHNFLLPNGVVTSNCHPTRHLPERPRLKVFYSNEQLTTIEEKAHKDLPEEARKDFKEDQAFEGCVKNCKMFAMCRGRLATEQKSESSLLKHVADTQELFASQTDIEKVQAQLLCWRPSRAGMIYPRMSRVSHMLSAAQIASMITGEEYPSTFGKRELINFFATQEVRYYVGIDHGFNHCFAGVLGVKVGGLMFIIDAFEIPGLELDGKIRLMDSRFKKFDPVVFADTSHPGDNKSIGKAGFKMRKWTKGPGSVVDGIGVVRMKLNPVLGKRPELYFLAGDPGVEVLFERMLKYAWVIDTNTGEPTNEPNEKDDDGCDATRYMVMNVFAPKGSFKGSVGVGDEERARNPVMGLVDPNVSDKAKKTMVRQQNWSQVLQHIGFPQDSKPITREDESGEPSPKRRGGLIFDLG